MTYENIPAVGSTAKPEEMTYENIPANGNTATLSSTDEKKLIRRKWTVKQKSYLVAMYTEHYGNVPPEVRKLAKKRLGLDPQKGAQKINKWICDEKKRRTIFKVERWILKVERCDEKMRRERLQIDRARRKQCFKAKKVENTINGKAIVKSGRKFPLIGASRWSITEPVCTLTVQLRSNACPPNGG